MTLAELAGNSVSVALISKVERGLVSPSLQTLTYLAGRLGVSPGALIGDRPSDALAGAIAAARARLLLGDPARAARDASDLAGTDASARAARSPVLTARLLALAAEAHLVGGDAAVVARWVSEGSALLTVNDGTTSSMARMARVELAWTLGLLQRRRGALADAERTWTESLAALEHAAPAHPWWHLLRAQLLGELGTLAEARSDAERARNLVARAATVATSVTLASGLAHALLSEWDSDTSPPRAAGQDHELTPEGPATALALAALVAADRLARRLAQEAARLERPTPATGQRPPMPDVPLSRHLQ